MVNKIKTLKRGWGRIAGFSYCMELFSLKLCKGMISLTLQCLFVKELGRKERLLQISYAKNKCLEKLAQNFKGEGFAYE